MEKWFEPWQSGLNTCHQSQ